MVNEEKTKLMVDCAMFEKRNMNQLKAGAGQTRTGYLRVKAFETFVYTTIGYLLLAGIYTFYKTEKVMASLIAMTENFLFMRFLIIYLIIMLITLMLTLIKEGANYKKLAVQTEEYNRNLEQIKKFSEKKN